MASVSRYRKKPVVIEAVQYNGAWHPDDPVMRFCPEAVGQLDEDTMRPYLVIPTLEGDHRADVGDFIIRGVAGEFYPCKPDIFEQTYESVP